MLTNRTVIIVFCISLAFIIASAQAADVVSLESGDCPVSIQFNAQSGMINGLSFKGESISVPNPDAIQFDFQVGENWIVFGANRSLEKFDRPDGRTLVVSQRVGDWRTESTFTLIPGQAMFKRSVRLTYLGTEPEVRLKAYWEAYPTIEADENAALFMPGNYPPRLVKAADLDLNKVTGFGDNSALICQVRGSLDSNADGTSALSKPLSVLFLYDNNDPNADRSGYEVNRVETGDSQKTGSAEGVRVKQVFQMKARMKPGDVQTLGTSYVWVLQQDRESAMKRIHDWQTLVGLIVPSDRPDWFQSAVLYAFHPGGTIGSDMNDWGGFKAAQTVLPRIRSLGVNALWILPVEDKSIYWPRDYYKLQDGLGTPDEYRELVAEAHRLGMNVLQDCVPHGGSNYFPRAKEHPEWLAYKEDGSTFDYWCFDFNWPTWREYMAGVVKYYMDQYDVDGYRVDAVGGSRTPNWAADLPYPRASFSQSQGGVNMLRSLRNSVKSVKPEKAGLMAEVQGSRYGAVADAVYDFIGCYSAFQAIRTQEPADFVKTLRRWLYESQYGEIKGLLRLRHIESHDSLRSQGWYGPQAMRALFALTCYIDGIPLIYQEQEIGNLNALSAIIQKRNQLPELQGGDADYMSVEAPDGVFACLRTKGENRSIVLINFNYEPVEFQLDAAKYKPIDGQVTVFGQDSQSQVGSDGTIEVQLEAYGYKIVTLRKIEGIQLVNTRLSEPVSETAPAEAEAEAEIKSKAKAETESEDVCSVSSGRLIIDVSKKSGLIERLRACGENNTVGLDGDLILPASFVGDPAKVKVTTERREDANGAQKIVVRRQYPTGTLILTYRNACENDRSGCPLIIDAQFEGDKPEYAALTLGISRAVSWSAGETSDEALSDKYFPRPAAGRPGTSSIYWRTQGTDVLYDSLFQPLGYGAGLNINYLSKQASGHPQSGFGLQPSLLNLFFDNLNRIPPRVQLLGRTERANRLTACVWLIDKEAPGAKNDGNCSISIANNGNRCFQSDLKSVAGGYLFENDFYRIRLGRGGALTGLWSKDKQTGTMKQIVDQGQLYTDYGWGEKGLRYSNQNEVEAAVRLDLVGENDNGKSSNGFRLIFQGRLRGKGRFEKSARPVEYTTEYQFAPDSPTFGFRSTINVTRGSAQEKGFLSLFFPIPDMDSCVWQTANPDRQIVCRNREIEGRSWQSASELIIPVSGAFKASGETLLTVSAIQTENVKNLFVDRQNLFFAFADSTPLNQIQTGTFEAQFTVGAVLRNGDAPVAEKGRRNVGLTKDSQQGEAPILKNGDFEQVLSGRISARYGAIKSTNPGSRPLDGWSVPNSARSSGENPKSGQFCLEVENSTGEFLLASQNLPMDRLSTGSHWIVRGFVRADQVKIGDISWKVGCLRLCATVDGKTVYFSSPSYFGSFDWNPVEFDVTIPDKCSSVSVQAGLNGATGKIWFDQISIVPAE